MAECRSLEGTGTTTPSPRAWWRGRATRAPRVRFSRLQARGKGPTTATGPSISSSAPRRRPPSTCSRWRHPSTKAHTWNGPLSLARCSGSIDIEARNGPVSVQAGGGRQRLHFSNGPLAIALEGRRYDGEGIDARVKDGPVSLTSPADYES